MAVVGGILAAMLLLPLSVVSAAAIEFGLASTASAVLTGVAGSYTVQQATYYSAPITLEAGHMVFTDSDKTRLKMPEGEYAITYFIGDIVFADTHQPVPLSEVYDHHWIAVSSNHRNQLCKNTDIEYVFGIGAESRHSPVSFSPGFGYHVANGTYWGANIHLLRTEGLAGDNPYRAAKECNECYYSPGKGEGCTPAYNGTFRCCGEFHNVTAAKSSCAVGPNPPAARDYQLRYTFNYTRAVGRVRPVYVGTLAAPNCAVFYAVQRNETQPTKRASLSITVPARMTLLFAVGHLHTGGLNISLSLNGQAVCTSFPTYGTELGVAGNEKGYLVHMSHCIDGSTGVLELRKGDQIAIDGHYFVGPHDPRLLYSDGTHLNVMSYLYVGYYRPDESKRRDLDAAFWGELQGPTNVAGGLASPLVEA